MEQQKVSFSGSITNEKPRVKAWKVTLSLMKFWGGISFIITPFTPLAISDNLVWRIISAVIGFFMIGSAIADFYNRFQDEYD